MTRILIFGGTTEGRQLAEFCHQQNIEVYMSVTSAYGAELLPRSPDIHVLCGRMQEEQMLAFVREHRIAYVIDATHPYALAVSEMVKRVCRQVDAVCYRVVRAASVTEPSTEEAIAYFDALDTLVARAAETTGNLFVTTGSKEMAAFCRLPGYQERVVLRVLDVPDIVERAVGMGYDRDKIIAMRGPFSVEENIAQFQTYNAAVLITKESGAAGGYAAKIQAAKHCHMQILVLQRQEEQGLSVPEMCKTLQEIVQREKQVKTWRNE